MNLLSLTRALCQCHSFGLVLRRNTLTLSISLGMNICSTQALEVQGSRYDRWPQAEGQLSVLRVLLSHITTFLVEALSSQKDNILSQQRLSIKMLGNRACQVQLYHRYYNLRLQFLAVLTYVYAALEVYLPTHHLLWTNTSQLTYVNPLFVSLSESSLLSHAHIMQGLM